MPQLDDEFEIREYPAVFELREVQAVGAGRAFKYLEGRAVPYDTWADVGPFMEQHAAGSFERSTRGGTARKVPLLMFHEQRSYPVGTDPSWKHEDGALVGVWKLSQRDDAQTAARSAAAGELGLSVGFQPIHSQIHKRAARWAPELGPDHKDWISRTESRLIEVSLTPIPVYDEAQVVLVRSAYVHDVDAPPPPTPMLDGWRAEAQRLRSGEH